MDDGFEKGVEEMLAVLSDVAAGNLRARIPSQEHRSLAALAAKINVVLDSWRDGEKKARRAKRELEEKLATIELQAAAIRELSIPIMEVWKDVLLVPLVGVLDSRRSADLMTELLGRIVSSEAEHVILDITGVAMVESDTADHLLRIVRAARLSGADCVLTGVSPAIAQTLVQLGVDLSGFRTLRTLKDGLRDYLANS